METRLIEHDDNHFDIEAPFPFHDGKGWSAFWAVVYCSHENPQKPQVVQAQPEVRSEDHPGGYIQDLSPVVGMANTPLRSDEMSDTTATHHKEWLEEKKDEFDAQISALRVTRDQAEDEGNWKLVELMDKGIDDLLIEKDNIGAEVPFSDAWCDPALDSQSFVNDPRSEWERDWDDFTAETLATREGDRPQL